MLTGAEITSIGPAVARDVRYRRTGRGNVALIHVTGIIGGGQGELDSLDVTEGIDRAIAEGPLLVVLAINSAGGLLDEVEYILGPAIQKVRDAGGFCAAYIKGRAHGAAYALACECSPVIMHPLATVGFLAVHSPSYMRDAADMVQARSWARIRERRPQIEPGVLGMFADTSVHAEQGEAFKLCDGLSSFGKFVNGRCGRC